MYLCHVISHVLFFAFSPFIHFLFNEFSVYGQRVDCYFDVVWYILLTNCKTVVLTELQCRVFITFAFLHMFALCRFVCA